MYLGEEGEDQRWHRNGNSIDTADTAAVTATVTVFQIPLPLYRAAYRCKHTVGVTVTVLFTVTVFSKPAAVSILQQNKRSRTVPLTVTVFWD